MDDMVRRLLALDDLMGGFGGGLHPALREAMLARDCEKVVALVPEGRTGSGGPAQVIPFRLRHHSIPKRTAS
jgi:hypothetical protein